MAALLEAEQLPKKIWEPAVGRGAIARVLEAAGHEVVGTDLIDYGAGFVGEIDFLKEHTARADCIVTNPPFMYGNEFVAHALELAPTVIMLLRLAFFESDRRTGILEGRGLRRIHVFRKRLPMMHRASWQGRKANSGMAFAWFRWDRGYAGPTTIRRISWKAPSGRTNLDTSAMAAEPSVTLSRATADSDCLQLIQRRDFHEAQTTD